jgi:hypothetical protein
MTPFAVFLNHLDTIFFDKNHLRFPAHSKNCGMPEAVLGFEKVGVKNIVLGNMAVVAGGSKPVGAMLPGGKLWRHDVAVDTGSRIIRQVRPGLGDIKEIRENPNEYGDQAIDEKKPGFGRSEKIRYLT